eukprot:CAMPEP_0197004172 /NCGR_PEP_ID=MMETSP1380-20130617/19639_1 /TAXON_ID=5936 /ORGANISM="Euplotes crassus, Strain CT5" /LENGTH=57 /DNA_ID=CAMNT_0042422873 /DNA_START=197 /DNA_END=370 /DNA_ORIENTATION=+
MQAGTEKMSVALSGSSIERAAPAVGDPHEQECKCEQESSSSFEGGDMDIFGDDNDEY